MGFKILNMLLLLVWVPNSYGDDTCECVTSSKSCGAFFSKRKDLKRLLSTYEKEISNEFGKTKLKGVYPYVINTSTNREVGLSNAIDLSGLVVVGVLTTMKHYLANPLHYKLHKLTESKHVTMLYVICNETHSFIKDPLVFVKCKENMNKGKTMDWFKFALSQYPTAKYIGKMDLDTYMHAKNTVAMLEMLPYENLVYARPCVVGKCNNIRRNKKNICLGDPCYLKPDCKICGGFYIISRDILERISFKRRYGHEDLVMTGMIRDVSPYVVFASDSLHIINMPLGMKGYTGGFRVQPLALLSSLVAVHQIKGPVLWKKIEHWLRTYNNGSKRCTPKNLIDKLDGFQKKHWGLRPINSHIFGHFIHNH